MATTNALDDLNTAVQAFTETRYGATMSDGDKAKETETLMSRLQTIASKDPNPEERLSQLITQLRADNDLLMTVRTSEQGLVAAGGQTAAEAQANVALMAQGLETALEFPGTGAGIRNAISQRVDNTNARI